MKFFKKSDAIIILGILFLALLIWAVSNRLNTEKSPIAEIYYGSELAKSIRLDSGSDKKIFISQNEHVIFHLAADGTIAFDSSNCPDQVCVRSGKLSQSGETAACLPNQIILKIVPSEKQDKESTDSVIG